MNDEHKTNVLRDGMNAELRHNFEKALYLYINYLHIVPNDVDILRRMAIIYDEIGYINKSIEFYRKILKLNEKDFGAWNNLGKIYDELGMKKVAIRYFKKALKYNPDSEAIKFNVNITNKELYPDV